MADLRIRIYNVLFGDAILLTIPETDENGHEVTVNVLIDVTYSFLDPRVSYD